MGSPLPHKCQVEGALPPPPLPAVYMPAEIPTEVDIPLPQKSMDSHGAHIICYPMEDMFNQEDTSELSTNDTPDPLKRRSKKKKLQGGLADCLEPHLLEPLDVEMSPVIKQGADTHPVSQQGATTSCCDAGHHHASCCEAGCETKAGSFATNVHHSTPPSGQGSSISRNSSSAMV